MLILLALAFLWFWAIFTALAAVGCRRENLGNWFLAGLPAWALLIAKYIVVR